MTPQESAACPHCGERDVHKMYVPGVCLDLCRCNECGAKWEVDRRAAAAATANRSD